MNDREHGTLRRDGSRLSRRHVLRLGALSLGTIGLSGLVACSAPPATAPAPTSASAASGQGAPAPAATVPAKPAEAAKPAAASSGPKTLIFIAGAYEPQLVRQNMDRFEQQYPHLKVDYTAEPSVTFRQKLTAILSTNARPVDLLYVGDEELGGWAEAGWLEPIDDLPGVAEYKKDLYPYNLESMTYKGKLYGLPYYSDFTIFAYNQKMLQDAGFSTPPETWEDVKNQALAVKKAGAMEYPMLTALLKGHPGSFSLIWSMVYAAGGSFFDKEMMPTFPDADPAPLAALQWLVDAVNEWKILDPKSLELNNNDIRDALAAGQALFIEAAKYDLQRLNDPALSKIAGVAKMTLFPRFSKEQPGTTRGLARMYSIAAKSQNKADAWTLLQYAGGKDKDGKYYTAKNWYLLKGLGFGWAPLGDDPEVIESTKKWGDPDLIKLQASKVKARENLNTPWYSEWEIHFQTQLQEAILQKISPKDALAASAKKAMDLRKEWS